MNGVRISRVVFIGFSLLTLFVMMWALGPFGSHQNSGGMMVALLLSPLLLVWGVGPYAVAHRFAAEDGGIGAWVFAGVQVLAGIAILVLYADAFVISPEPDLNAPLVFAILPIYQFVAVLAAYYALRLWRRYNAPESAHQPEDLPHD
ncbi:MAG: hypothetical protein JNM81_14810 [Rhodospirillaceae bacterium]|nr:hypothetical protein [Rhodospirillaceae bacterium]